MSFFSPTKRRLGFYSLCSLKLLKTCIPFLYLCIQHVQVCFGKPCCGDHPLPSGRKYGRPFTMPPRFILSVDWCDHSMSSVQLLSSSKFHTHRLPKAFLLSRRSNKSGPVSSRKLLSGKVFKPHALPCWKVLSI